MDRMRLESPDMTARNIDKIEALFPGCITEMPDEEKSTADHIVYKKAVNFTLLKQMLSGDVLDGDEAYEFTWVGKKAAIAEAGRPVRKTLRPCKKESRDWDTTENLYIEGDNLEVLKLLQESYLGKVKMIYIDPPYNTGHDFVYPDSFLMDNDAYNDGIGYFDGEGNINFKRENSASAGKYHSDWCSMIYPRLALAGNLLSQDGCIFISINDMEVSNLRKICDEIFGASNFVADLIWANREGGGSSDSRLFRIKHEHIICYSKNIDMLTILGIPISNAERYKSSDEYEAVRGKYYLQKLGMGSIQYSASLDYPIEAPDGSFVMPADNNNGRKACWRWSRDKFNRNQEKGMVEIKKDVGGTWTVYTKQYMNCDNEGNLIKRTQRPMGIIDEYSSTQASKLLEQMDLGNCFSYSKPVGLIKYLISRLELSGEIVLDFFSGSATTAHSVMELNAEDSGNRRFIMVQLPEPCDEKSGAFRKGYENICEIGKERIRRAGDRLREETDADIDYGFRVFKLDDSNMTDVYYSAGEYSQNLISMMESNIKAGRTGLDLLFGCLLEWGLPLSMPYTSEKIGGCTVHTYGIGKKDMKKLLSDMASGNMASGDMPRERILLTACFDKNIPEDVIRTMARRKPLHAVYRDSGFSDSSEKINMFEIFKWYMPEDAADITKRVRVI